MTVTSQQWFREKEGGIVVFDHIIKLEPRSSNPHLAMMVTRYPLANPHSVNLTSVTGLL